MLPTVNVLIIAMYYQYVFYVLFLLHFYVLLALQKLFLLYIKYFFTSLPTRCSFCIVFSQRFKHIQYLSFRDKVIIKVIVKNILYSTLFHYIFIFCESIVRLDFIILLFSYSK
jgi:hypothetical protein